MDSPDPAAAALPRKLRRGRPRKPVENGDESIKLRRERNRQAQLLYRARKHAAQVDSEQHLNDLEATIMKLTDELIGLTDDVLHSKTATLDPQLMLKVHERVDVCLALARATDAGLSDETRAPEESGSGEDDKSNAIEAMDWADISTPEIAEFEDPSVLAVPDADAPEPRAYQSWPSTTDTLQPSQHLTNVFGNGWPAHHLHSHRTGSSPMSLALLRHRLVHFTIYHGYFTLLNSSTDAIIKEPGPTNLASAPVRRMFGPALRHNTREEVLFALRWYLGPGSSELDRLARAEFGVPPNHVRVDEGDPKIPWHGVAIQPAVDASALISAVGRARVGLEQPFVNASYIETYLEARGARAIDEDVMELPFDSKDGADSRSGVGSAETQERSRFVDLDVFFPSVVRETPAKPAGLTRASQTPKFQLLYGKEPQQEQVQNHQHVRISLNALMYHLTQMAATCLFYGPGYRKDKLERSILASITEYV